MYFPVFCFIRGAYYDHCSMGGMWDAEQNACVICDLASFMFAIPITGKATMVGRDTPAALCWPLRCFFFHFIQNPFKLNVEKSWKRCLRQTRFCHPSHAPLPAHSSIILGRWEAPGFKPHLAELPSLLLPEWMLRMGKHPFMGWAMVDIWDLGVGCYPRCN